MGPSWAAGELLITLLTAAIHHPEVEITITKAIDAVFRLHHGALTHGGGKAKATPRTLWNAWKRFRPVVHFHAVRRLYMLDYPERDFSDWFTSAVEEYLAAAEVVREQAVMRRFLPASGLWTVPKSLKLPKMEVELAPLTPELLDIIRSYKPEHSRDD